VSIFIGASLNMLSRIKAWKFARRIGCRLCMSNKKKTSNGVIFKVKQTEIKKFYF
jgi:hypothetical protein